MIAKAESAVNFSQITKTAGAGLRQP